MKSTFDTSNFNLNDINLNFPNLLIWVKDNKLNYISCNENFSELSDLESPTKIKGKSDFQLAWISKEANFYRNCDKSVLTKQVNYYGIENIESFKTQVKVFVTKYPLLNRLGKCIGVIGTGCIMFDNILSISNSAYDTQKGSLHLGKEFNNAHLTRRELSVLKWVLLGYTAKRTARVLNLSPRSVEIYIETLKQKLQCSTKNEIIAKATELGIASTVSNISAFIEDVA